MGSEGCAELCAFDQHIKADLSSVQEVASSHILCRTAAVSETIVGSKIKDQIFPWRRSAVKRMWGIRWKANKKGRDGKRGRAHAHHEAVLRRPGQ